MARVLTAARVTVPEHAEPVYLETVARLAQRFAGRGGHLWVFRSGNDARTFLEFRECRWPGTPGPADAEERRLEERLRHVAMYFEADLLWHEVNLPSVEA